MIQPPFAVPTAFRSALAPQGVGETELYIFSGDQLLVQQESYRLPSDLPLKRQLYMGSTDNCHHFAGELESQTAPHGWSFCSLKNLFGYLSDSHFALAGRALQLLQWDRNHRFCGRCGGETFPREHERCRECKNCGHLAYPILTSVAMALIKKGDEILLARSPHFPGKWYSVIAGFMDPGETLEQCVMREVREEVGLKVKNLSYFGSQPWPFSNALMVGFTCEWESGEIVVDPVEIEHAAWFHKSELPELPPPLSLARLLIDSCSGS